MHSGEYLDAFTLIYSSECVEGEFSEVRGHRILIAFSNPSPLLFSAPSERIGTTTNRAPRQPEEEAAFRDSPESAWCLLF